MGQSKYKSDLSPVYRTFPDDPWRFAHAVDDGRIKALSRRAGVEPTLDKCPGGILCVEARPGGRERRGAGVAVAIGTGCGERCTKFGHQCCDDGHRWDTNAYRCAPSERRTAPARPRRDDDGPGSWSERIQQFAGWFVQRRVLIQQRVIGAEEKLERSLLSFPFERVDGVDRVIISSVGSDAVHSIGWDDEEAASAERVNRFS